MHSPSSRKQKATALLFISSKMAWCQKSVAVSLSVACICGCALFI
jgi:hypothetical protein